MDNDNPDKSKILDEIMSSILSDDLSQASRLLNQYFGSKTVRMLSARLIKLEEDRKHGVIKRDDYIMKRNEIRRDFHDEVLKLKNKVESPPITPRSNYVKLLAIGVVSLLLFSIVLVNGNFFDAGPKDTNVEESNDINNNNSPGLEENAGSAADNKRDHINEQSASNPDVMMNNSSNEDLISLQEADPVKKFDYELHLQKVVKEIEDNMVFVEGGEFEMGKDMFSTGESYSPIQTVKIPSFYINRYEITREQYKIITGREDIYDPDSCATCPAEKVSWWSAKTFITRLNKESNIEFRLPTEAEWEYAGKGGRKSKGYSNFEYFRFSGSDIESDVAWFRVNSGGKAQPVGLLRKNELDLYDMSGNVYEWCEDDWHDNYVGAPIDGSAWVDKNKETIRGVFRVTRGNNYGDISAPIVFRGRDSSHVARLGFGFRVASKSNSLR